MKTLNKNKGSWHIGGICLTAILVTAFISATAIALFGCSQMGDSKQPSSNSASSTESAIIKGGYLYPTAVQQKKMTADILAVFKKYKSGDYPVKLAPHSDAVDFTQGFPPECEIPKEIPTEKLSIENADVSLYAEYGVAVTIPLENDFAASASFYWDDDAMKWVLIPHLTFADLQTPFRLERISTAYGTITKLTSNRLGITASFEALTLKAMPQKANGSVSLQFSDLSGEALYASLSYADGNTYHVSSFRNTVSDCKVCPRPKGLTDSSLSELSSMCGGLMKNIAGALSLTRDEDEMVRNAAKKVLSLYKSGSYPLDVIPQSEYYMNDPFPGGIPVPEPSAVDTLQIIPNGWDEQSPLCINIPLEKGYVMQLYFAPPRSKAPESYSALQAAFVDPNGRIIPHPKA